MAITPTKPQNRILLIGGIVFALLAGVVVFLAVSKAPGTNGPTVNVWVAAQQIPAGTTITKDLITQVSLPQNAAPVGGITDPAQAIGKNAPVTISQNTAITTALLSSDAAGGSGLGAAHLNITKNYVALAIPAKGQSADTTVDQVSVGYYIQPEDHIDIMIDGGGPLVTDHVVRYAFQDVRVLKVGTVAAPAATGAASTPVLQAPLFYVVELPRNQAEQLTAIISGKFVPKDGGNAPVVMRYVLRPQAEYSKPDKAGNYPAPNYENNVGTPVPPAPDLTVTPGSLANSFNGH